MTDQTPLDRAHAAMQADPEDAAARLRFYERLADAELFVLLFEEPRGEQIMPQVFDVEEGRVIVVFDREERLAEFARETVPYVALSGRLVVGMLAGQGIGLGVNLSVAPSSILIPAQAVDWLAETLQQRPTEIEARPEELHAPAGLPEPLLSALDAKLAAAGGLAKMAYLAGVSYAGGARGHMLAFIDPAPGAEGALAQAAGEALTFSGIEAGAMDVGFFAAADPIAARLAKVGLRFDLPQAEAQAQVPSAKPGMDPAQPPKLR
ncbi:SseB family protein [Actibacterium sp. MT2.3-13A]|uniref:SseB family protein n=1 Tax=Actibacterium sp. MT2.3-13A TaxID=2828332 RepID=UPI001BACFFBE|nr:SseB family protein [Actibacterium sp. MT2.3-13A]